MKQNKKYGNILPCLIGAHHFTELSFKDRGQYRFVEQECEDCHRLRTRTLWQVQYEGTPSQSLPKTRLRPTIRPTHAHA